MFIPATGGGQKTQDGARIANEHESLAQKINMAVQKFDENKQQLDQKLSKFRKELEVSKPDYYIESK